MGKVIFSIGYNIIPEKREDYMTLIRELKNLVKADGLESYSVYELKNKKNTFSEIYVFSSAQAYEDFDDNQDERVDILMTKLSDLIVEQTTSYTTQFEVE